MLKKPERERGFDADNEPDKGDGRVRRWHGSGRPGKNKSGILLPELIKVYAVFSKIDGKIVEEDIDSSLAFLRYDYPEEVYSELRSLYGIALRESVDISRIASDLDSRLQFDEKIQLAIQLYVLIARAAGDSETFPEKSRFLDFTKRLGIGDEARAILTQLSDPASPPQAGAGSSDPALSVRDEKLAAPAASVLETLQVSSSPPGDLIFDFLSDGYGLTGFRCHSVILIKNTGTYPIIARGEKLIPNEFLRLYPGQRAVLGEVVFTYEELAFYFNSKKNVSSTRLYLAMSAKDSRPVIERRKSRTSSLEIKFGLRIEVTALKDVPFLLKGAPLVEGKPVFVSPRDRLTLDEHTEFTLAELRKRAREFGGRFELEANKTEYLVSNNSALLKEGDILLSTGKAGEVLLKLSCNQSEHCGELQILKANDSIMVGNTAVRQNWRLKDGDTITIGEAQHLRCDFSQGIIEEIRNFIKTIEVRELSHRYGRNQPALDALNFSLHRGEMVCVMGPSGSGKSTLLSILAGHIPPSSGEVLLNGQPLQDNARSFVPHIALIPDHDTFDPNLTVEENFLCAASIRSPHLSHPERQRRVDNKLVELGLNEQRHRRAGTPDDKTLSGGERKRLNAGLDMTNVADVFVFDEPTSGLSSKDAEHVMEIIRSLAHNKIVVVSIHQPSSRIFQMFDKALLIDHGGKLAYFGKPDEMLHYFAEAYREEFVRGASDNPDHLGLGEVESPTRPEFIFDVLETPLRDFNGEIIYETDRSGKRLPARRFVPNFWRDRLQARRLLDEVKDSGTSLHSNLKAEPLTVPAPPGRKLGGLHAIFVALVKRAFLSKLRNRGNIFITLIEAPVLALLIATVLRFSEDKLDYNFAVAFHIPTYIFLTLVVGMFLGLTNSADEIIRDLPTLNRERNYRVPLILYITAKFSSLAVFALIQCFIYLLVGNAILEVEGMMVQYLFWMFLSAMVGVASGLLISSLVREPKTATNIIPLILVPQIILGGALIKYEQMNRNLDFVHSLRRVLPGAEEREAIQDERHRLQVPFFCEFMPLRWTYEGLTVAQAERNPLQILRDETQRELDIYKNSIPLGQETKKEARRLQRLKDALAVISSLNGPDAEEVRKKMDRYRSTWRDPNFNHKIFTEEDERAKIKWSIHNIYDRIESILRKNYEFYNTEEGDNPDDSVSDDVREFIEEERWVTADEIYTNIKVMDLVYNKAEPERLYMEEEQKGSSPNIFLATRKIYFGERYSTVRANAIVMLGFIALAIALLWLSLRRRAIFMRLSSLARRLARGRTSAIH